MNNVRVILWKEWLELRQQRALLLGLVLLPVLFWPFFFELPALVYLGFWALSQVWSGTLSLVGPRDVGGVAWWAHVGGFMAGIVLHVFFARRGDAYRQPARDEYALESAWVPARYWRDE